MNYKLILLLVVSLPACSQLPINNALAGQCELKPAAGRCRANFTKYHFDKKTAACATFTWGGCGGVVPFDTREECHNMCVAPVNSEYLEKLANSFFIWERSKAKLGNSYQYVTAFSSWVGFGNATTIMVKNGTVVSRTYRAWDGDHQEIEQWLEHTPKELGMHSKGAPIKTIDELYAQCRTMLSTKDSKNNHIYLDFEANGFIEHCLFAPKNCADDCSSGVRIKTLHFL